MDSRDTISRKQKKDYLTSLLKQVSIIQRGQSTLNMSNTTYSVEWLDCVRPLTEKEFEQFLLFAPDFIVEPTIAQCGFNFGVRLYDFPEKKDTHPQAFFFISGEYLPNKEEQRLKDSFRILSPLSHNERNELFLKAFGLNLPEEKSCYEY